MLTLKAALPFLTDPTLDALLADASAWITENPDQHVAADEIRHAVQVEQNNRARTVSAYA